MSTITKVIRGASSFIFLVVLLYVYAYLPDPLELPLAILDVGGLLIGKGILFYSMLSLFAVVAIISFWIIKLISALPGETAGYKRSLINWSGTFAIVINIFLIISLIIIAIVNNTEQGVSGNYTALAYAGPLLIVIWLFWLLVVLAKRSFSRS